MLMSVVVSFNFTARRYASAVYVYLSVCHKPILCRNDWTDRARRGGLLPPILHCVVRISGSSNRVLSSGTFDLENFATASLSCCLQNSSTVELVDHTCDGRRVVAVYYTSVDRNALTPFTSICSGSDVQLVIIIIIIHEYYYGGAVALLLQDHLTVSVTEQNLLLWLCSSWQDFERQRVARSVCGSRASCLFYMHCRQWRNYNFAPPPPSKHSLRALVHL